MLTSVWFLYRFQDIYLIKYLFRIFCLIFARTKIRTDSDKWIAYASQNET